MAWTSEDYPLAFKDLNEDQRSEAIEIANTALEGEQSEEEAIKQALAAVVQAEASKELEPEERLLPHGNGWAVLNKDGSKVLSVYGFYKVAQRKLKEFDKAGVS